MVAALVAVIVLGAAHLLPPALAAVRFVPRGWLLSAAGGVSVAYVFVHLLPEVAEAQAAVEERGVTVASEAESFAYLTALVGLVAFYGLERAAVTSRGLHRRGHRRDVTQADASAGEAEGAQDHEDHGATSSGIFWLSTASFAVYNAVVGYLVVHRARGDRPGHLALFVGALALHFVINDLALRKHHRIRYDRFGRPILVGAIVAGALVGAAAELSETAVGLVIAFLGGGIALNVIKEEIPQEGESRFVPFALGAAAYTVLLLLGT